MGEAVQRVDRTVGSTAFRGLYEAHYMNVLAYCARRTDRNDAGDLAAEVFTVAWRRIDTVPTDGATLPWLYGVAYRVVSHHWRSERRRRRLNAKLTAVPAVAASGPEMQLVQRYEYDLVIQAASRLRPLDQEVLRLVIWEELSHPQIADMLGSTVPAVKQRFHRAKRILLREFKRVGGTLPRQQGDDHDA